MSGTAEDPYPLEDWPCGLLYALEKKNKHSNKGLNRNRNRKSSISSIDSTEQELRNCDSPAKPGLVSKQLRVNGRDSKAQATILSQAGLSWVIVTHYSVPEFLIIGKEYSVMLEIDV